MEDRAGEKDRIRAYVVRVVEEGVLEGRQVNIKVGVGKVVWRCVFVRHFTGLFHQAALQVRHIHGHIRPVGQGQWFDDMDQMQLTVIA